MNRKPLRTMESCTCDECKSACNHIPGWFKPSEIFKVAEYLGLTVQELFDKYLGINYYLATDRNQLEKDVFVLTPATTKMEGGDMFPWVGKGTCVFLDENELCSIHPVKPFECAQTLGCAAPSPGSKADPRMDLLPLWEQYQAWIEELYGKELTPFGPGGGPSLLDVFETLFGD